MENRKAYELDYNIRASSFAHRVVNDWNKLPTQVVLAKTPTAFKHLVDGCWSATFPELL